MKCGDATIGIEDAEIRNNWNSDFIKFLREEGFLYGGPKGYFCGDILFVNLSSKRYAFNWPGVGFTEPIANTYISIEDFKTIYNIYKKYSNN